MFASPEDQPIAAQHGEEGAEPFIDKKDPSDYDVRASCTFSPRESIISHLNQFLDELRDKKDEDGSSFVTFPPNYQEVITMMRRVDLQGSNQLMEGEEEHGCKEEKERPWTTYLLEEGLQDATEGAFVSYKDLLMDDGEKAKVLRGLAKIRQLDLKLSLKTREAREQKLRFEAEQGQMKQDLEDIIQSIPYESLPRRALFEKYSSQVSTRGSSAPCSPMNSARSSISDTMSDILNGRRTFLTDQVPKQRRRTIPKNRGSNTSEVSSLKSSRSARGSRDNKQSNLVRKVDHIKENISKARNGLAPRSNLTTDEELRYQILLWEENAEESKKQENDKDCTGQDEEEDARTIWSRSAKDAWMEMEKYGFGKEDVEKLCTIEEKLKDMQDIGKKQGAVKAFQDPASPPDTPMSEALSSYLKEVESRIDLTGIKNKLEEDRIQRKTQQRLHEIDSLLDQYHRIASCPDFGPADYISSERTIRQSTSKEADIVHPLISEGDVPSTSLPSSSSYSSKIRYPTRQAVQKLLADLSTKSETRLAERSCIDELVKDVAQMQYFEEESRKHSLDGSSCNGERGFGSTGLIGQGHIHNSHWEPSPPDLDIMSEPLVEASQAERKGVPPKKLRIKPTRQPKVVSLTAEALRLFRSNPFEKFEEFPKVTPPDPTPGEVIGRQRISLTDSGNKAATHGRSAS